MTIAYFDCFAGISGDMTLGALIDAGAERALPDATVETLRLGDEVNIDVRHESRGHVGGTRVVVEAIDRVERTIPALRAVVDKADAPSGVKASVLNAINRMARAESRLHGTPEDQLHLHELGGADTLVDVIDAIEELPTDGRDRPLEPAGALCRPRRLPTRAALEEHHFRGSAGRPLFYALLKETRILPAAAPLRLRALRIDGRRIHQVGMPYNYGMLGFAHGDSSGDLIALSMDPNVSIHEAKSLTCDIRPGRREARRRGDVERAVPPSQRSREGEATLHGRD